MDILNIQINRIQDNITMIDDNIAALDASTIGSTGLQCLITCHRANLVEKKNNLTNVLSDLQMKAARCFTSEQQIVVDSINTLFNNKYESVMNKLLCTCDSDMKTAFFDLYNTADTDLLRECVIIEHFKLPVGC